MRLRQKTYTFSTSLKVTNPMYHNICIISWNTNIGKGYSHQNQILIFTKSARNCLSEYVYLINQIIKLVTVGMRYVLVTGRNIWRDDLYIFTVNYTLRT